MAGETTTAAATATTAGTATTGTATTATATDANTTGAVTTAAFSWATAGLDADTSGYVTNKGWKGPADVVASYRGAEKLLGVPADQIIKLPQGDAPDFGPVYDRLGRPKAAGEYGLDKLVPKGSDPKFAETAAGWFHEQGLNTKQATALTTKWNEHVAGAVKAGGEAQAAAHTLEVTKLKGEWGTQYDTNIGLVDRAIKAFGVNEQFLGAMKNAVGPAAALKFFHNVGTKLGTDDAFIAGDGRGSFLGGETAEQAASKKAELIGNKAWVTKFNSGDQEARREMARLNKIISPGTISF